MARKGFIWPPDWKAPRFEPAAGTQKYCKLKENEMNLFDMARERLAAAADQRPARDSGPDDDPLAAWLQG